MATEKTQSIGYSIYVHETKRKKEITYQAHWKKDGFGESMNGIAVSFDDAVKKVREFFKRSNVAVLEITE